MRETLKDGCFVVVSISVLLLYSAGFVYVFLSDDARFTAAFFAGLILLITLITIYAVKSVPQDAIDGSESETNTLAEPRDYQTQTPLTPSSPYAYKGSILPEQKIVVTISEVRPNKSVPESAPPPSSIDSNIVGGVYMLKSVHSDSIYYKIGRAKEFDSRIKRIALQLPYKVEVVHKIYTLDASKIEKYWHEKFKSKRANGEWFKLNDEEVAEFKRWKKMWIRTNDNVDPSGSNQSSLGIENTGLEG